MSSRVRSACLVAVSTTAVVLGLTATSHAAPTSGDTGQAISTAEANATLQYWTPERMAGARNADPALVGGPHPVADSPSGAATSAPGPAMIVPPTPGTLGGAAGPLPTAAVAVPRPYHTSPLYRLNGKVFFTGADGGNFVCSGTVVNSQNKDMVDTAGHCVSDGKGKFHKNWIFVPAYSSQSSGSADAPFGKWTARYLATTIEWHNFSNLKQDLGYGVMNTLESKHIAAYLGGHGSAFNQSRTQTWTDFGYPQAAPFNGFDQYACVSGRLADDNPAPRSGPLTVKIDCDMTGGSSGGGWLIRISNGLYVNSHNSYKYSNDAATMYGPYYGTEASTLFKFTEAR